MSGENGLAKREEIGMSMNANDRTVDLSEIQSAIVVAQSRPRDEKKAYDRIMKACERHGLASQASYLFPRGGKKVTGPSIRLAEVLAQNWGNIWSGTREVEVKNDETVFESYCWDLETNSRVSLKFSQKHGRFAKGKFKKVEDPRDVYEVVASTAARRRRACILAVCSRRRRFMSRTASRAELRLASTLPELPSSTIGMSTSRSRPLRSRGSCRL